MKDETGKRYGRLVVVGLDHIDSKHNARFLCKCDCGCTTVVKGNMLRKGRTKSCGCLLRETSARLGREQGMKNIPRLVELNKTDEHRQQAREIATTHGGTNERLFRIWSHMRERCMSANGDHARWYHDKGICVCEEWDADYAVFRKWAYENGYIEQPKDTPHKELLSIDRIDPMKGYSPDNCRWITVSENSTLRNQYHANQR
jgi:hypothetical protein